MAERLNRLADVEVAYPQPLPVRAPTPDYTGQQGYLHVSPSGVDLDFAATWPGGTGQGVQIFDLEYSWNTSQEDLSKAALPGALIPNQTPVDPFNDPNHGTAVLGELVGDKTVMESPAPLPMRHSIWSMSKALKADTPSPTQS